MLVNADTARVRRARRPPARTQEREAAMATTTHHLSRPVEHEAVPDSPGERALQRGAGFRLALVSIDLEGVKRDTICDIVDPFRDMSFSEGIWP